MYGGIAPGLGQYHSGWVIHQPQLTEEVDRDLRASPEESHGNQGHDSVNGHLGRPPLALARLQVW